MSLLHSLSSFSVQLQRQQSQQSRLLVETALVALLTQPALGNELLEQLALLYGLCANLARRDARITPAACNVRQRIESYQVG